MIMNVYDEILKSVAVGLAIICWDRFVFHLSETQTFSFNIPVEQDPFHDHYGTAVFYRNGIVVLRDRGFSGVGHQFDLTEESSIDEMRKWFEQYKTKEEKQREVQNVRKQKEKENVGRQPDH